jgi:hypothetical protein
MSKATSIVVAEEVERKAMKVSIGKNRNGSNKKEGTSTKAGHRTKLKTRIETNEGKNTMKSYKNS